MTLVGRELAWGPGGKPPEAKGFYTSSDEHQTLFGDTGRSRISVRSMRRIPQKLINYRQMSMLLYLNCDTSRIGVGSRGGPPGSPGVLGNKLLSDEHAFYTLFGDMVGRELAWGPGAEPPEAQGFYTSNYRQMSIF